MTPSPKILVIVRHAHRDKPDPQRDNGLSEKGMKQAKSVRKFFEKRFGGAKATLLSSRKRRCMETLEPLAEFLETPINEHPLLIEQGGNNPRESSAAFEQRVRGFCDQWKRSKTRLTVICTHGDWIPVGLKMLVDLPIELKKGGWAEIHRTNSHCDLTWVVQEY